MLSFSEFDALIGHDSYVLCRGKERIDSRIVDYKTALSHIERGGQIGYWVQPPYIILDIDEGKAETIKMIKSLGIKTLCCATPKGVHMYFKTNQAFTQKVGMIAPFGLKCDFRCAKKGYVLLPYGTSGRAFNKITDVADLPRECTPLTTSKQSLLGLKEGDGRNAALFAHLMQYKRAGATEDQIIEMATVINDLIFDTAMHYKELIKICSSVGGYDTEDESKRNPFLLYDGKTGRPTGVNYRALQDHFANRGDLIVMAQSVWQYTQGVYRERDSMVRGEIQNLINDDRFINPATIMNGYKMVLDDVRLQENAERLNKDKHILNFTNGLWDIERQEFTPHDPSNIQSIQIPHALHMDRGLRFEDTKFYDFIRKTKMPKSDAMMLLDFMAYSLTMDNSLKVFMMLVGPSNTGKSVLIRFISTMVGAENTSALSIGEIQQRFYPSRLYGKLLNACGDNAAMPLSAIENLKKITGNDPIMYEAKGKDPFFFVPFSKLLFSFNQLPLQLEEKSNAFYKRCRILQMTNELFLDNAYVDDLIASTEEMLPILIKRLPLREVTTSKSSQKATESLHADSDSIHAFIKNQCVSSDAGRVEMASFYEKYVRYCVTTGREAHKYHNFNRYMEALGYGKARNQAGARVWSGITFRKVKEGRND